MAKRYVVECIWSGYRSSQSRPCHRMVIDQHYAKRLAKIHTVQFTDGTTMSVDVRPCKLREKVQEIRGYRDLLSDFAYKDMVGLCRVQDLIDARKLREEQCQRAGA